MITVVLVLAGLAGLSYRGFREGGWVTQGVGKISDAYINYPLIALGVTVALFFAFRTWRNRKSRGQSGKFFDYIVYALMAAGIYFIGHYVLTGTI
jgi:predicted permease